MLAVYICLALFMKTPERIIVPLLMVLFLVFLSAYDLRFNLLVYPIVVTVIIFLGSFIYNFWDMHVKFDADGKLLTQEIDKYSNVFGLHSGKIFLLRPVWPYRLHNFSRITDKKLYGVPSNYLYSGLYPDLTNGPVNGLYHKLVKDNYLVIYTDKHKLSHLKNYYKEHLGYSVSDSTLIISKLFRACVLSKVKPVK